MNDLDDDDLRVLRSGGSPRAALVLGAAAALLPFFLSLGVHAFDVVALGGAAVALVAGPVALWRAARSSPRSLGGIVGALVVLALVPVHLLRGTPIWSGFFAEREAARALAADGFEDVRLTPRAEGGFAFEATRDGERCRGSLERSEGLFESHSSRTVACGLPAPLEELEAGCAAGDARACREATERLRDADPTSAHATELAERGCLLGEPATCFYVGVAYQNGDRGVARSVPRALEMYERSCVAGIAPACFDLGLLRADAGEGAADRARSCDAFERACELEHARGCFELGVCFDNELGRPLDRTQARALFERACSGGALVGCDAAGLLARRDDHDDVTAVSYFQRACDGHEVRGCTHLATMRAAGRGGLEAQPAEALAALDGACRDGHAPACLEAGLLRNEDRPGLARDPVRALADFERGCELGDAPSCRDAGVYHRDGRAGAADRALATQRFSRACELGDAQACDERSRS